MAAIDKAIDRERAKIEKTLHVQYERAKKELVAKWDKFLETSLVRLDDLRAEVDSATTPEAKKAAQKNLEDFTKYKVAQDTHFRAMVDQVNDRITNELEVATAYVNDQIAHVYTVSYNAAGKSIAGKVPGYSFELADENTLKNLAKKPGQKLLPFKKVDPAKTKRWNMKHINAEVTQGILQGESIDKIAERITHVIGDAEAAAVRTARTTVTSAQNKGRMDQYHAAEDAGVIIKKRWMAFVGDPNTRDWHADLDGEEVDIDEPFENDYGEIMYPGDPSADPANVYNCRCTLVEAIKGVRKGASLDAKFDPTDDGGDFED